MSATDELRALLDKRGVKYTQTIVTEGVLFTVATSNEHYFILVRDSDAGIKMWSQYFTFEQAIDATLGPGTCHDTYERLNAWQCSECGGTLLLMHNDYGELTYSVDSVAAMPRYCPNCGRRVVDS